MVGDINNTPKLKSIIKNNNIDKVFVQQHINMLSYLKITSTNVCIIIYLVPLM